MKVFEYTLCSKNRNDYKNTKDGIRGICLQVDKIMKYIGKEEPKKREEQHK